MSKRRTVVVVAVTAVVSLLSIMPARAARSATPASCPSPDTQWDGKNPWCYDWQGSWVQQSVSVPSVDGPLTGTEFAPLRRAAGHRVPAVAILHGLGGNEHNVWYLARFLAGHGYIAVTVTTAGNSAANYPNAMKAMVDFLRSADNPLSASIDTTRLGAAGHSAGARATSWVQDEDYAAHPTDHVQAVVALDNLTSDLGGDAGSYLLAPQCTTGIYTTAEAPITPRVPAMGLASDKNSVTCPERNALPDPDAKKFAWSKWRAAGIASVELVLRDASHLSFDQDATRVVTTDSYLELISNLTKAWFDGFLLRRTSGLKSMVGSDLFGAPRDDQLSTQFRSAVYLPPRMDCDDFRVATCHRP